MEWIERRTPALSLVVYLAFLLATSYWHGLWADEFFTFRSTSGSIASLIQHRAAAGHPPLFFILEKIITAAMGQTVLGYRLLPIVCAAVAIALVYSIARCLKLTEPIALLTALTVGTLPALLSVSQIARSYSCVVALVTLCNFLIIRHSAPSLKVLASIACCACLALYTHQLATISVLSILVALIVCRNSAWIRFAAALVIGAAAYMPFYVFHLHSDPMEHIRWIDHFRTTDIVNFPVNVLLGNYAWRVAPMLWIPVSGVLTVLIIMCARSKNAGSQLLSWQIMASWAAAAILALAGTPAISVPRYFSPVAPLLVLSAVSVYPRQMHRPYVAAVLLGAIGGTMIYLSDVPFRPDNRSLARYLTDHVNADDIVVVASRRTMEWESLLYYYSQPVFFSPSVDAFESAKNIYLIQRAPSHDKYDRLLVGGGPVGFQAAEKQEFSGVEVIYLKR